MTAPFTLSTKPSAPEVSEPPDTSGDTLPELDRAIEIDASDVTITELSVPWYRTASGVRPLGERMTQTGWSKLISRSLGRKADLVREDRDDQIQSSFEYRGNRWRVTYYECVKGIVVELRRIRKERRRPQEYGIPQGFFEALEVTSRGGFLLVTGPTGSGKSTTLAAAIDYLNENFAYKIQVFDDPIENEFTDKKSWIGQSEYNVHFKEWASGTRKTLRRDPDVIVIGEMLDLDAIEAAITASATGHLVLSTLHTMTAAGALTRLNDSLKDHPDVLSKLGSCFLGVLAQRMLEADGPGGDHKRIVAYELLLQSTAVANVIRQGRIEYLAHEISTGAAVGMVQLDDYLEKLVNERKVLPDSALKEATDPENLRKKLVKQGFPVER